MLVIGEKLKSAISVRQLINDKNIAAVQNL